MTVAKSKIRIDTSNLEEGLKNLTGAEFEKAEREARRGGDTMWDISLSKAFQARLAAKALNVNITDIQDLPLPEYTSITVRVSNFLFGTIMSEMGNDGDVIESAALLTDSEK